ncbi:hypothetical protein Scep_004584 [Stephania cephalantha]|uniref:Uncharacterized protein n=1 Tax=Stephania cephalantha TaxID=152367 RepID=A0AAP0KV74_9MAGN
MWYGIRVTRSHDRRERSATKAESWMAKIVDVANLEEGEEEVRGQVSLDEANSRGRNPLAIQIHI